MPERIALLLATGLVLACTGPHEPGPAYQPAAASTAATAPATVPVAEVLRPCDDGGSHGGVLINGVCL